MRRFLSLALGGLALVGCSPTLPDAPSLAPRPAERLPILPPDPAREPDRPESPALQAELDRHVAAAHAGHAAFEKERAAALATIGAARGAAEGSERWIAGQQALSGLDSAKAPVRDAASAIDALRADPAHAGPRDRTAIDAAAATVEAMAKAEAAALDRLGS